MRKFILLSIPLLLVLGFGGFYGWASGASQPMPEAVQAMNSSKDVTVTQDQWVVFQPYGSVPSTGLIFYPGGKVDYRSYAPAMHEIAAQGYLVVLVPMPLNLAVFSPRAAEDVIKTYPQVKSWVISGHSLGGSMAANFALNHQDQIRGLVLWASYPASTDSLAKSKVKVISISGELDGLATPQKVSESRPLLPSDTTWLQIKGGDHAQFGWYGPQSGDNPAEISRQEQQNQVIDATVKFLQSLSQ